MTNPVEIKWPEDVKAEFSVASGNGRVGTDLVSETETVRVWHVRLEPGQRLKAHHHVLNYFWTATTPGRAVSRSPDGQQTEIRYQAGDTRHLGYAAGESMIHDLENVGETTLCFVTVEFKDSPNTALALQDDDNGRKQ